LRKKRALQRGRGQRKNGKVSGVKDPNGVVQNAAYLCATIHQIRRRKNAKPVVPPVGWNKTENNKGPAQKNHEKLRSGAGCNKGVNACKKGSETSKKEKKSWMK